MVCQCVGIPAGDAHDEHLAAIFYQFEHFLDHVRIGKAVEEVEADAEEKQCSQQPGQGTEDRSGVGFEAQEGRDEDEREEESEAEDADHLADVVQFKVGDENTIEAVAKQAADKVSQFFVEAEHIVGEEVAIKQAPADEFFFVSSQCQEAEQKKDPKFLDVLESFGHAEVFGDGKGIVREKGEPFVGGRVEDMKEDEEKVSQEKKEQ